MRALVSVVLLFSIILNNAGFARPGNSYVIRGNENTPAVVPVDQIRNITSEVAVIRPYRTNTEGIRDELSLYRGFYILFALFQGYVLIKAAARQ